MFDPTSESDLDELGQRSASFNRAIRRFIDRRLPHGLDEHDAEIEITVLFIHCRAIAEGLAEFVTTEENEQFIRELVDEVRDEFQEEIEK